MNWVDGVTVALFVFGLFVGLEMKKKSAIFFISWCSDMLPVQVIWLLGYSVKIKKKKFSYFFGLP